MRRDMDLIRLLLLAMEGEGSPPDLSAYDEDKINYHSILLVEAGLVHGEAVFDASLGRQVGAVITAMTWSGHEFLDLARNQTAWEQAKKRMKKAGFAVGVPLVLEVLKQYAQEKLHLPP